MRQRQIGSLSVSAIGLGCNNFGKRITDESRARQIVHAAVDAGITFFDTADIYGGTVSGSRAGARHGATGSDRDEVQDAGRRQRGAPSPTTFAALPEDGCGVSAPTASTYQLQADPDAPVADTLGRGRLVGAGKVREIRCSTFSAAQLREADASTGPGAARFVSVRTSTACSTARRRGVLPSLRWASRSFRYFRSRRNRQEYDRRPPAGTRLATYPPDRVGTSLRRATSPQSNACPCGRATTGTQSTSWPSPG
jgi:hypothetical protein